MLEVRMAKIKIKNYPLGPFPTVIAGVEVEGKPNYVTLGACGVVCMEPVFYISLKSSHYSTAGVRETGYFSVNIPSVDMVPKTDYCGVVSGRAVDKSVIFNPFYDERGKAPLIRECPLNFLCRVVQTIPVRGFDMFLGEIVVAYIHDQCLTEGKPDPLKINPLILMGTHYYSLDQAVGDVYRDGMAYQKDIQA
jgi:flavin reductase (DIM6/NTAB) family NADH-FMN oxidoreductase RutF